MAAVRERPEDPARLARHRELLAPAEKEQERRFRFPLDRQRYLLTRALVRTVLSRYVDIAPADWRFTADRYGRPHIDPRNLAAASVCFNLSHTTGLILLGVTRAEGLGVDTEQIRQRHTPFTELAERFFSPAEALSLRGLAPDLLRARFFELWTLKESYIKACGQGLSIPLDQFSFTLNPPALLLQTEPPLNDDPERWRFWLLKPSLEHLAAVCARRQPAGPQRLIVRKTTSLDADEIVTCEEIASTP